jgi:hypothetical protein
MGNDLVAVEVKIDPILRAPSLRATEQAAVEAPRGIEIVNREGEVEWRQGHALTCHCEGWQSKVKHCNGRFLDCLAVNSSQ